MTEQLELFPGGNCTHDPCRCLDCGLDTVTAREYYLLCDDVWAETRVGPQEGVLCIGCVEGRLGRRLNSRDFTLPRSTRSACPCIAGVCGHASATSRRGR
jgi:hypothetical protein